jgi:uncharacterized membrane protein
MGLFSLTSLAALVWIGFAYAAARRGLDPVYWTATPATLWIQLLVTLAAFLLMVPGLMTPNPTSVRQEARLDKGDAAVGMVRITRHPFLWGVALWSAGHLMVNGDLASVILFATLFALSVFGGLSIDAKRRRALGARWDAFAARTSYVPFAAILQGRERLSLGEIGPMRIVVALAAWAILLWAHPYLFGASPLPHG